jgi:hypothetical protein
VLSPPSLISLHRNLPEHVAGFALAPRVSARLCDFEEIHIVILMTVLRFPSDTKMLFLAPCKQYPPSKLLVTDETTEGGLKSISFILRAHQGLVCCQISVETFVGITDYHVKSNTYQLCNPCVSIEDQVLFT